MLFILWVKFNDRVGKHPLQRLLIRIVDHAQRAREVVAGRDDCADVRTPHQVLLHRCLTSLLEELSHHPNFSILVASRHCHHLMVSKACVQRELVILLQDVLHCVHEGDRRRH